MKNGLNNTNLSETLSKHTSFSGNTAQPPVVLSADDSAIYTANGKISLPIGNAIVDAQFSRIGRDLLVETHGERGHLITNYYGQETPPALISDSGKHIRPETIKLLAGDPAAHQYAGPAEGAAPIGTVEKLAGTVLVSRGGEDMQLKAGEPVYQDDVIHTNADGSVGITFIDGSVFSLGNEARMTLDSLVYDPATGEGSSEVTVLNGMFKFISGDIAANNPGDMVVETPVATIGIRGTTGGGNVQGPGMENQFFLEPNADGTVGWFDVTTEGGTVSMNQPFMQVSLNNITTPPPPPSFTTSEFLQQHFSPINNVLPQGRYDHRPDNAPQNGNNVPQGTPAEEQANAETASQNAERQQNSDGQEGAPESSELLGMESSEPDAPEGEPQGEALQAGESTAEGTNTDQLTQVAGNNLDSSMSDSSNFDGQQESHYDDPTQNPLNDFITKDEASQTLQSGKLASSSTTTTQQTSTTTQTSQTTQTVKTATTSSTQTTSGTTTTTSSSDSYYQNLQDQVRVGNLPQSTLTGSTSTATTSPTSPTPTTSGGTTTTAPAPSNGSGTAVSNLNISVLNASVTETINGGAGSDNFIVNDWNKYINPTAPAANIADILHGGAGLDTLKLLSHTGNFYYATEFNTASTGIDRISFEDTGVTYVAMSVDNAMVNQSDNNMLTIAGNDKDVSINISGLTDATATLVLTGEMDYATLNGGSQAEFVLNTTALNMYHSGSGLNMKVLGGNNTLSLGGTNDHKVALEAGNNNVTLGGGNDEVNLNGGTQYVSGEAGEDVFHLNGGSNHTISGGTDADRFMVGPLTSNNSLMGGSGDDDFIIMGGSGHTIDGGDGNNFYDISGNASLWVSNVYSNNSNQFDIRDFSGTANLNVISSSFGWSDNVRFGMLNSGANVNLMLDDSSGTATNVSLNFNGGGFGNNTYTQSGNNLIIGTRSGAGGNIVLKDYFIGDNSYNMRLQEHEYRSELKTDTVEDFRELDSGYTFSNMNFVGNALSVSDGSNLVTISMVGHGLQTGDMITLSGFGPGDEFEDIVQADVNGSWVVNVIDGDTFTYTLSHVHINTTTPGMTTNMGGGVTITLESEMYADITSFNNQNITGAINQIYIAGKGGNDTITGANDTFTTVIHGGDGNDRITGYSNDVLKGGYGSDILSKADGAQYVQFYGGDTFDNNFDMVDYGNLSTYVVVDLNLTSQTTDTMSGSGNDYLEGIEGIRGTAFADILIGANGAYRYNYFDGGAGNDTITGGTGTNNINSVDYSWISSALTVTLDNGSASVTHAEAGNDTLDNIQNILGGAGNDSITGDDNGNALYGNGGIDTLMGGLGSDTLYGGAGNDMLKLGNGSVDSFRDVVGMEQSNNGTDTVHEFGANANVSSPTLANMQDAIDISKMLNHQNLHGMNYFDLLKKGFLQVVQNGADTMVKLDINGADSGGLTTIANLINTTADNLDWKHFITSEGSEYLVNSDGSSTDMTDDIYVATGINNIYAFNGNDIIDIRTATGRSFEAYDGDDIFVLGDATIINSANMLNGGADLDTLVVDFASLDFSSYSSGSVQNFEVIDLFGNQITQLNGNHIMDMSGGNNFMFVESTKAGANLSLDSASFTLANPSDVHIPPIAGDIDASQYTTYVADVSGTEVYVHVNNSVSTSLA